MKRIVLILAMICATIANASAQEIFKEVKRLEKQAETFANDTTKNINERKIACFKYDAIFYLIDKGSQEGTFTEYDLGEQTNAMIDFVNLFVKRLSQTSKAKDKDLLKAKFRTATINNSLFNDVDKEVIYSYVDNDKFITQFSLDTDWVKALEAVSKLGYEQPADNRTTCRQGHPTYIQPYSGVRCPCPPGVSTKP